MEAVWKRPHPALAIESRGVTTISLRVRDLELAQIDERAVALGMTRTAFMLRAALDVATADERRLQTIETRLSRVETVLFAE